jgi:hypothetical protein
VTYREWIALLVAGRDIVLGICVAVTAGELGRVFRR